MANGELDARIAERRGRVVKAPRRPVRQSQRNLGVDGATLIEYVGNSETLTQFPVGSNDTQTDYWFSNRPADCMRLMDKAHADYLLSLRDNNDQAIFVEIASYSTHVDVNGKKKSDMQIPNTSTDAGDDLPSGFADDYQK